MEVNENPGILNDGIGQQEKENYLSSHYLEMLHENIRKTPLEYLLTPTF
jgi:hypothetical protein